MTYTIRIHPLALKDGQVVVMGPLVCLLAKFRGVLAMEMGGVGQRVFFSPILAFLWPSD